MVDRRGDDLRGPLGSTRRETDAAVLAFQGPATGAKPRSGAETADAKARFEALITEHLDRLYRTLCA